MAKMTDKKAPKAKPRSAASKNKKSPATAGAASNRAKEIVAGAPGSRASSADGTIRPAPSTATSN